MEVGALPGMTDFQPRWDRFRELNATRGVNCFTPIYFDSALAAVRESEVSWMRATPARSKASRPR
jgi:hypothetical protein